MPRVTLSNLLKAQKDFSHWLYIISLDCGYWKELVHRLDVTEVTLRKKSNNPDSLAVGKLRKIRKIANDDEMFFEKLKAML